MSFLAPAFLIGLLTLAVPVAIHLIQRERKQVVEFPSLMFLQKIPYQSVRRRRIRHWLLLAMRLAGLALIVTAFARPFLRQSASAAAATPTGARELIVLLDQSYSMGYGDRWDRARSAARDAVRALSGDDRATLVLFSTSADAVQRSTTERGQVLAAIDAAKLSSGATRYGPALKLAQTILAESKRPRREALLISDFQRNGWRREDAVHFPEGAVLTPVAITDPKTTNVLASGATFQRAPFEGQERVTVAAALVNRSDAPARDVAVALELDGREIQSQRVTIEANASGSASFAPFTLSKPNTRGAIRVTTTDPLPQDNAFYFVLSPAVQTPVLLLERAGAPREESLYLTRALAIGDTPRFQVETLSAERVAASDFDKRSVVIFNNAPAPSAAAVTRLARFVEAGGGLLIASGERAAVAFDGADILPGPMGPAVDRAENHGASLSVSDYSHPVFEVFRSPRSGDFSTARFFRYRTLTIRSPQPSPSASGAPGRPPSASPTPTPASTVPNPISVLARFDDGSPALVERKVGEGRVLVWTSTLDAFWNDLALKPVFLPFVHQLARYLSRYTDPTPWMHVGQVADVGANFKANAFGPGGVASRVDDRKSSRAHLVVTPSGKRLTVGGGPEEATTAETQGAERRAALDLAEQGFYEVRVQGAPDVLPASIAANLEPAESDLTALDPHELVASVGAASDAQNAATEQAPSRPEDQERRQNGWWYLLLAGLALLGIETVSSNILSRSARGVTA